MGTRGLMGLLLACLMTMTTACEGPLPGEQLDFEPVQGSVFYNWFGGEIYLSFKDDHTGTLWVLMTMDCDDGGTVYPVRRAREPAKHEATVRLMLPDGSLPRFFGGEAGTLELLQANGELAAAIQLTLIDEETGVWVTLDGVYPIQSIAMS